jgi:hypothetical protein
MTAYVNLVFQPKQSPLFTAATAALVIEFGGRAVRNLTKGVDPIYAGAIGFVIARVALFIKEQGAQRLEFLNKHNYVNAALAHTLSGAVAYGAATAAVALGLTAAAVTAQTIAAITITALVFDQVFVPNGKHYAQVTKDWWDKKPAPALPVVEPIPPVVDPTVVQ